MVRINNCTATEFKEIIKNKKLTVICVGKKFNGFLSQYNDVDYDILYLIDNSRAGETIKVNGKSYAVIKADQVGFDVRDSILVITSSLYANEVVMQLDSINLFDGLLVYIPDLFELDESPFEFTKKDKSLIPPFIHYCWFGKTEIPDKFKGNIETWKKHCPNYEIRFWNEDNYDISKCRYMKQAYDNKRYGFVPDYARLDIIYSYGGIYLDVDVELLRPWDQLLYYPLFCGFENENYVAFGLGFGAQKGNQILKEMMEDYQRMDFFADVSTDNKPIPSPIHQTRILKKHGLICDGKSRDYGDFLSLSPMYFAPVNLEAGIRRPKKDSFSIHQYAGTWLDDIANQKKNEAIRKYSFLMRHMEEND